MAYLSSPVRPNVIFYPSFAITDTPNVNTEYVYIVGLGYREYIYQINLTGILILCCQSEINRPRFWVIHQQPP